MKETINPHYTDTGSIKNNTGLLDTWFLGRFSLSPYQGCQHGCLYCDGRAEKYYVEGDFERDIRIRRTLPLKLRRFVRGMRETGFFMIGSGVSDAYQPIEAQERLMPELLSVLDEYSLPISLLTKSALPLRDIELFDEINSKSRAVLLVTITTVMEEIAAKFEPEAATVEERFDMIEQFSRRGIPSAVMMMPLLPGISDSDKDIAALIQRAKESGAVAIMPGGLTLRPGRQKRLFVETIADSYPDLMPLYDKLYRENRQSGSPIREYSNELYSRIYNLLDGFPTRIPHRHFRGVIPVYDEIYAVLSHMFELYPPSETLRLRPAFRQYEKWLKRAKKDFSRMRNETYHFLEARLRNSVYSGRMAERLENPRLTSFISDMLDKPGYFDYQTKRWRR